MAPGRALHHPCRMPSRGLLATGGTPWPLGPLGPTGAIGRPIGGDREYAIDRVLRANKRGALFLPPGCARRISTFTGRPGRPSCALAHAELDRSGACRTSDPLEK